MPLPRILNWVMEHNNPKYTSNSTQKWITTEITFSHGHPHGKPTKHLGVSG